MKSNNWNQNYFKFLIVKNHTNWKIINQLSSFGDHLEKILSLGSSGLWLYVSAVYPDAGKIASKLVKNFSYNLKLTALTLY